MVSIKPYKIKDKFKKENSKIWKLVLNVLLETTLHDLHQAKIRKCVCGEGLHSTRYVRMHAITTVL